MIELLRRALDEELGATGGVADALRPDAGDASDEEIVRLAAIVEDFLRTVPDGLSWALTLSKDPACGHAVAFATGPILTYVFDEKDLLPESSFGALGLLDDAYLVHSFVAVLARAYPFASPAVAYEAPEPRTFEIVAALLPDGVAQALLRTCESTLQVAQALFGSAGADIAPPPEVLPAMRVAEAVGVAARDADG
jgi:hypothetical protein